ncbi:AEC family transporter [Clostridium homopropionicum]|uniref:AEC family transporter n=1 Tax=Clostridium homopropionicum TaxID=36844 RepID=UPI00068A94E4|nr:AEC family transporter [Clostridium homopropionicum]
MSDVISNTLPIILFISFGFLIQRKEILKKSTIIDIKKIVMNISLPAVLFITFINMDFKKEYYLIILCIILLMTILYFTGAILNLFKRIHNPLNPFMSTGFSFGLLGVPLYGTVFGVDNLGKISVIGVGHELYMWFIFFTLLKIKFNNDKFTASTIIEMIKSPLIIGVVLGILLNITGFKGFIHEVGILKGIFTTIQYMANIATPLILIIVGYDLKINKKYLRGSIRIVILRIMVVFIIGYAFKFLVLDALIKDDKLFDYAYFTFLILPPPFSTPIFMDKYNAHEYRDLANNVTVLDTIICIIVYVIFVALL